MYSFQRTPVTVTQIDYYNYWQLRQTDHWTYIQNWANWTNWTNWAVNVTKLYWALHITKRRTQLRVPALCVPSNKYHFRRAWCNAAAAAAATAPRCRSNRMHALLACVPTGDVSSTHLIRSPPYCDRPIPYTMYTLYINYERFVHHDYVYWVLCNRHTSKSLRHTIIEVGFNANFFLTVLLTYSPTERDDDGRWCAQLGWTATWRASTRRRAPSSNPATVLTNWSRPRDRCAITSPVRAGQCVNDSHLVHWIIAYP